MAARCASLVVLNLMKYALGVRQCPMLLFIFMKGLSSARWKPSNMYPSSERDTRSDKLPKRMVLLSTLSLCVVYQLSKNWGSMNFALRGKVERLLVEEEDDDDDALLLLLLVLLLLLPLWLI